MQAIREVHDVLGGIITIRLPAGFSAQRVEVIVLPADPAAETAPGPLRIARRRPAPELAGTVIRDDLIEPAISPDDWDALK
ncbi:MAG: hypothetical protein A3E25_02805 [Burkholderiales bacterium RIFCSPHIGHO2_12_FULL_69_20]|nr:MAG: hypothetical protein A3E25_02805 [Burkholderiales bacterium RIFCSPHIGHO2_12_FULL_69_20]